MEQTGYNAVAPFGGLFWRLPMVMITLQHKRRVLAQLAKQGKEQLQQAKAEIAEPEKPTAVAVPQVVLSTNPALAHKQRVLHRLGQVQLVDSLTDGHAQK